MGKKYFNHSVDGFISISDGNLSVDRITIWQFVQMENKYVLSEPHDAQYYEQGFLHIKYINLKEFIFPSPWVEGDLYIGKVAYYIENIPVIPPTLEEAKADKIKELLLFSNTIFLGGIDYKAMSEIFKSSNLSSNSLISYKDAGTVPAGFMIKNFSDTDVVINLEQMLTLNSGIVELHYLTEANRFDHKVAINALSTVPDVLNYDITTGWETVPYVI